VVFFSQWKLTSCSTETDSPSEAYPVSTLAWTALGVPSIPTRAPDAMDTADLPQAADGARQLAAVSAAVLNAAIASDGARVAAALVSLNLPTIVKVCIFMHVFMRVSLVDASCLFAKQSATHHTRLTFARNTAGYCRA
jgi:hypothetical protein